MLYLVENDDAFINNWGCYWLVEANNAKQAVTIVYEDEALNMPPKVSGIYKKNLHAYKVSKLLKGCPTYMIA